MMRVSVLVRVAASKETSTTTRYARCQVLARAARVTVKAAAAVAILAAPLSLAWSKPRPADPQEAQAVARAFAEAWNRHDMEAFAALFSARADFVNVIGLHWSGRAEIKRAHEALHATRMKRSRLTIQATSSRWLRPEVALVHATWELVGDTGLGTTPQPARHGVLSLVLVRDSGRWLIEAAQNTDIVPLPNVPPGQ